MTSPREDVTEVMDEEQRGSAEPAREEFRLTRAWLVVGLGALVIGLLSGWIMSSATFVR